MDSQQSCPAKPMETVVKQINAYPTPVHDPVRLKASHATFQISKELLDSFLYGRQKVERIDVGKLMEDRKRKADNTDNEYSRKIKSIWCEECCKHIQGECPIHHVNQGLALTYAVRSFPLEVQLCTSSIPGYKYGACAGKPIPCGTWIGPYEGKRVYSTKCSLNTDGAYVWEIYENGQFSHFIDGSNEEASSWMRFIRCARNKSEQNMGAFQYGQNIYYRALRDIPVNDEILVWYDHTYTQFWGVPLALTSEIKVREDTMKKSPTVAQHSGLQGFRGPPQVPQQTTSTSTRPQNIPPAQRSPTMPVVTTNVAPVYSQPTTYQLQRPTQVPPQVPYQVPSSFQVQQPFQPLLPSPASPPYPPPSQLPPFPMVPPSSRMPLVSQGNQISQVSPQFPPQTSTRVPQLFPTHQLAPTNNPLGIPIAKTFSRSTADQKERAPMSYTTTVTSSPYYRWSPTEVKENLPVSGQMDKTDTQIKTLINSKPLPLQNRPLSLTNTAPSGPEDSGHVSSTVDSNQEEGSWKCGQCGKTFGQRLVLQMHVCSKSPERPFQCGHCSLSFADSSELRDHVVTHTNDRPFKCGFCGRSFAGATTLNNHMRAHTGEKPFVCEKCGRTFAIATQLNRHIKLPGECRMRNKDAQIYSQRSVITAEQ